jgi:hypothetical protein
MKKTILLSIAALFVVSMVAVLTFAFPFEGFGKTGILVKNDSASAALEAGDYDGYMSALEAQWLVFKTQMTKEKFNTLVAQHKAMLADMSRRNDTGRNDSEAAAARTLQMEKIKQAITDGDYAAWKEAMVVMENVPKVSDKITADNFATYVKLQQALENKDVETAKELSTELGLDSLRMPGGLNGGLMGRPPMNHLGDRGRGREGALQDRSSAPSMPLD